MNNKILFDGSATQGTKKAPYHGGGEYAKFILRKALALGFCFDIIFKKNLITDPQIISLLEKHPKCKIYEFTSNKEVYKLIVERKYQKFYSALPHRFRNYSCTKTQFIQVIHGLRSIELPWDLYRYKYYHSRYMRFMARIISSSNFIQKKLKEKHIKETQVLLSIPNSVFFTASEHSKYALLNFYPFLKEKDIKVFYSPSEFSKTNLSKRSVEKYYLMVNGNRYEKNIYRAIKAFDKLITDGRLENTKIIITGCDDNPFLGEIKNPNNFKHLPYVNNQEIELLYMAAYAFVYPSLNEGFGYPPLKAMGYGVPVIASACTSICEICDNGALYFNPYSVDELCNRILQIEYNKDLRQTLIMQGLQRVKMMQYKQENELDEMLEFIFDEKL